MPVKLHQLLKLIHTVPQIPDVVRTLINQLNQPNADLETIAKNIEKEQIITLKVLRLVNSAHFGLSRKVNSIDDSTAMIGLSTLKTLVIASGIISSVPAIENFNIKQFWKNSFQSANYARWFAQQAGLNTDIAYAASLLRNLGHIIIYMGDPSVANEIDLHVQRGKLRIDLEKQRLGYTSQQVCAELCKHWNLGEELIIVVENSGEPYATVSFDPLACAVYLGYLVSDCLARGIDSNDIVDQIPLEVANRLDLDYVFILEKIGELLNLKSQLDGMLD